MKRGLELGEITRGGTEGRVIIIWLVRSRFGFWNLKLKPDRIEVVQVGFDFRVSVGYFNFTRTLLTLTSHVLAGFYLYDLLIKGLADAARTEFNLYDLAIKGLVDAARRCHGSSVTVSGRSFFRFLSLYLQTVKIFRQCNFSTFFSIINKQGGVYILGLCCVL